MLSKITHIDALLVVHVYAYACTHVPFTRHMSLTPLFIDILCKLIAQTSYYWAE